MTKLWLATGVQILVTVGFLQRGGGAIDWSIGCFKEDLNNPYFNVSAGNYVYKQNSQNSSAGECVEACSSLHNGYKLAALTPEGVCLCSSALTGSLQKADSNTSCLYGSSDGLYFIVYPITPLANISIPGSVMIFQEFLVNISTVADESCSYTLDFNDGRQVTVTAQNTSIIHIYKNAGTFPVTLSSQALCLPEVITVNIEVKTTFGNVSLDCPAVLETTDYDSSCTLLVMQGSMLNTTLNSTFLGTVSDTTVQSLGIISSQFYKGVTISSSFSDIGTYLLPLQPAVTDGILAAFEVHLNRSGSFKIQIFSPKCPTNKKPCFGDCVSPDFPCGGPAVSECSDEQEMCVTLGQCNSTSSCENGTSSKLNISFIEYVVRTEFTINIKSPGYSFHRLSSPVPMLRGDVIGWYLSYSSASVQSLDSISPVLFYPNQEFAVGAKVVGRSLGENKLNRAYYFRAHLQITSVLELGLTPFIPRFDVNVSVSSAMWGSHKMLSRTIMVQERIHGLHLISVNVSKTKYFGTMKDIYFAFKVTNGSDVRYIFDAGDGSEVMNGTSGNFSHSYQQRGQYALNVTALNEINNVTLQKNLTFVNDLGNLSFTRDPWDTPGEKGVPYLVKFRLDAGDGAMFVVQFFDRNYTLFLTCDNSSDQELSANHSFSKIGIYNITVQACSKYLDTNLIISSRVKIMQRIDNLTLFEIKNGKDIPLGKELARRPYTWPLHIRAKVSSGSSLTFTANVSGTLNEAWKPRNTSSLEGVFKFEFTSSGVREITITARNGISQVNRTFSVTLREDCESRVSFVDKRNESDPLRTTRDTKLSFNLEERLCNSSSCSKYTWTLFLKDSSRGYKIKKVLNNTQSTSQDILFIPKGTLESGSYKLRVNTSCEDRGEFNPLIVLETYFLIERTKPVALILGGDRRDVAYGEQGKLVLDASSSYDPDEKHFDSKGLVFEWICLSNRLLVFQRNTSQAQVNMGQLVKGSNYKFQVTVSTSDGRSGVVTQRIYLVDKSIPTTEIKCKINCLPFVVTTERLSLEGFCQNCGIGSDVIFNWCLRKGEKRDWSPRCSRNSEDTFTTWNGSNIVIKPNVLEQNKTYQLELRGRRDQSGNESLSVYEFKTSNVPMGGHCTVRPSSGYSVGTNFQVLCHGWSARYYPLTYSIRYQSSFLQDANVSSVSEDNQIWILWYHGHGQTSSPNILPSGPESKNYFLDLNVQIQDKYGSYTSLNMSVQVKRNETGFTTGLKSAVSDLKTVDVKSHPETFTQLVTTYSTILNEDSTKDVSQTKKIRLDLVQQLSRVNADSLPLIKQTTDAVKLATYESTEVTHKTQTIAADTLKKMSSTLVDIASDPTRRNGQVIDETAINLFSGLSKILDASFFTGVKITKTDASDEVRSNLYGTKSKEGSELEKIGKETQDVVRNIVSVIQDITFAMLKKKLIGEQPTVTQTNNFDMKLDTALAKDVDKMNRLSKASGQFLLPQDEMLFSNENYSQVYTEFIAFKKNPFSWDIERSPFIQPHVLSLSFKTDKNAPIAVRNLSKDIEIFLFNEKQNIHRVLLESSKDDPRLLVYNFKVTQSVAMETILLNFQRSNGSRLIPGAQLFIRFGKQVSQSTFDFSHQFTNCSNCEGHSIDIKKSTVLVREFKKLELNGGRVSVGVLPCAPGEMSIQSCNSSVENFTVYVTSVSCRFWDKSQWRTEGCSVGLKSTSRRTHCLCNHLTSFGSYIVRPNPLTKFSLEDFKKGYVIFVAVAVIFLIYILIFVWARRADRTAFNKDGICVLPDNNLDDRYRYEIAIWTGMRRNAGTESEVTIILSGDLQDSEPRRLSNPNTKGYQRGSLEKFILTTPEDIGSLYCIRICHDNSKGSWYLSRVMVTDLEREEQYYFICDRWLAVDEDDGAIERLLPIASDEELTEFQRLFFSRTKRNLSDSHLWISVWNRPPQSQFTRVQRLSCCLCLLMITMVTNVMFYNARSEPKANSTNFIGSYSFTWDEIFIGVSSSLIIFPVNIIILYIFRHVRQKPSKRRRFSFCILDRLSPDYNRICASPSVTSSTITTVSTIWGPGEDEEISSVPDSKINQPVIKKKKKKKVGKVTFWSRFKKFLPKLPSSLPYWFVYIAWFFLVVLTLGSAAVLILYGMEFGNGRSLQWLFSTVVSICEDIFVLQPLKVLVLALIFALLVKKPDEGEFSIPAADMSRYGDKELPMTSGSRINLHPKTQAQSPKLAVRPDVEQLKTMRKARLKERKMFGLINEIIVHLLFSIVIALVAYGHKDSRAIFLFRNLDGLSSNTEKIRNFSVFWNWSQTVLIPIAFPEDVPSYGFFDDGYNNLISRARMRLLRVKQDSCTIPSEFKNSIDFCTKDYSIFEQDEACYNERWTKTTCTSKNSTSPWSFQGWNDLDGYPYWGCFETYSGSGYITELIPGINNNETANKMKKLRWLDRYSRALAVELTVYNANVNLFASILLLFEFPNFGGVFFRRDIRPMRLRVYVGGFSFFIFACEVVFLMFIAMYLYLAVKKIYRKRVAYFKEFWNLIDFAIVAVSLAAIGVYIYRIDLITNLMQRVKGLDGKFVNFQYATYWNEVFDCVVATIVCLTTIKLTKLMRFNLRISLFSLTLKRARPAIMAFSLQFGIVFFAYVLLGVLVFGHNSSRFKSIPSAILSLGCQILGKNQFTGMSEIESEPVIGPAFFLTFVLFVCWIYLNMFIGIIIDAYHQVQLDCGHMTNEYEMMEFFLARVRAWSGLGKEVNTHVLPAARWQRAGVKVKAVNKFGRHRRVYQPSNENIALEKTADVMERLETSIATLEKKVDDLQTLYDMEP